MDDDRQSSDFVVALKEGYVWQQYTARLLDKLGFEVRIDPLRIAPSKAEAAKYEDWDDLRIRAGSGRWVTTAVKSRKVRFTGPNDYPYPKCIVDDHHSIHKQPRLAALVVVSQYTKGYLVIPMTTRPTWDSAVFMCGTGDNRQPKLCYWLRPDQCRPLRDFLAWVRAT